VQPTAPPEPTAVVVDEMPLVRAGMAATLRDRGIEVVAETHAAREAVRVVTMDGCRLVVLGAPADLALAEAARRLVALRPTPRIVALVPHASDDIVGYLVALGVAAVVPRAGAVDDVDAGIAAALKGVPHVAPGLIGALSGAVRPALGPVDGPVLSPREREVLVLLAEGRSNREIAGAMAVTVATVKTHLVHVYAKLGAGNRNEALGRALALGLLT
jgi:DNA-binding NarL/FixJ family response regulator